MIRYRCPHCAAQTVAHERRVGQSSVCKACLKSHQIPTDPAVWLTETGERLHAPAAPVEVLPTIVSEVESAPAVTVSEVHIPATEHPADLPPTVAEPELKSEPVREPEPVVVAAAPAPVEPPAPREWRSAVRQSRGTSSVFADSGEVATVTPPPQEARNPGSRTNRSTAPVPVPRANTDTPRPYAEPVQLQTQADIAVALTAALTSRMKPAPTPRPDLRPSTAAWMLLTGIGVAFALVALFTDLNYRWPALLIGAAEIVIGYAWVVRLTHLRDPKRGRVCAVPPLTFYYLAQRKYAKFRPLRFVLTGAVIVALALAAPGLANVARPLVAKPVPAPRPADPAAESKLAQLRKFRDQLVYDELIKVLDVLVVTDPIRSAEAKDRAEIAVELENLCSHQLTEIRIAAMAAYPSWDPTKDAERARNVCLKAIRSPTHEERMRALLLLPRWKDPESARAVQSRVLEPGPETARAEASLEEIGPPAEQAALALLKRAGDDQRIQLIAIRVLQKVGGRKAADELNTHALVADHHEVQKRALAAVAEIESRLRAQQP